MLDDPQGWSYSILAVYLMISSDPFLPLATILRDVEHAIASKKYYPALVVALTIPEICVTLCWPRQMMVNSKHYAEFIDRYTIPSELGLNGTECYHLRGGVIHRGNAAGHPKFRDTHVIFIISESQAHIHALSMDVGAGAVAVMLRASLRNGPVTAREIAKGINGAAGGARLSRMLETLVALGQARSAEGGRYSL